LAGAYYKANCLTIKADLLGDIGHHDYLLNAILREVQQLSEFEQKRIVPYDGCVIYVRRLPGHLGDRVKIRYSGSSEHGIIFGSSSLEEHPFAFIIGEKRVLPGFENAVIGMCQGETKDCLTSSRRCLRSFFRSYLQKEIIINDLTSVKEVGIIHSINKGPPLLAAWETR
jgi:hypothetical protein